MNSLKTSIKKLLPAVMLSSYHFIMAILANILYGRPSNKLIVIGITGTKGKSTTAYLLARILEGAGHKVGMSSGIIFKVGGKEWLNDLKMTMPGRFAQQKLLRDMVKAGCAYAIIETTSEGIKQFRHRGINYDVVIFTNLYPEHIEAHGSFANYREAKGELFFHLTRLPRKKFFNKKISLVNLDDKNSDYFSFFPADEKYGFTAQEQGTRNKLQNINNVIKAQDIEFTPGGTKFKIANLKFEINLLGEMNVYNALAAITASKFLGISNEIIQRVLLAVKLIPGRVEFIEAGQSFRVVVDYAHDPESLRQLFAAIRQRQMVAGPGKLIHVFGATGGGRDKAKRAVMGGISDENCDVIILTNDDPYQEDPEAIIEQIYQGMEQNKQKVLKIVDRREAIKQALSQAAPDDLVIITGKGSEQAIMLNDGRQQWDDRQVVRELLGKKA